MPGYQKTGSANNLNIAYFISPHGFGHAARATAVMQSIRDILPSSRFEIFTGVPPWFFEETLVSGFEYHELLTDIGIVQETPLQENLPETLQRLSSFLPFNTKLIDEIAQMLLKSGCRLVLCDISPLGIASAKTAAIPSILIENFTWDWIYYPYKAEYPEFNRFISIFEALFQSADFHIQTEPVCLHQSQPTLVTYPVGRKPKTKPEITRSNLGIPDNGKMVLITMGGIQHQFTFLEQLEIHKDVYFVVPGGSQTEEKLGHLILLPHHSQYYHPDLISASDALIGKAGYSTIAEAFQSGLPFGFITRSNFRESEPLANFLMANSPGFEIGERDFLDGQWISRIPELLSIPRQNPESPNGADQIATFIQQQLTLS